MNITVRRPTYGIFEVKLVDGSTTIDLGFMGGPEAKSLASDLRSAADDLDPSAARHASDLIEALDEALDVIRTLDGKDNSCDEPYQIGDLEAVLKRARAAQ